MDEHAQIILITGSSGRIGTALIHRLSDRFRLIGFDDPGPPYPVRPAHCMPVDIESSDSVRNAVAQVRRNYGRRLAAVIHLAAYYSFSGDPSIKYDTVNVQGTKRLVDALQDFDVGCFVFAGTMLVHTPSFPGRPIDEGSAIAPKWEYPKSKLAAENLIRAQHGRLRYAILRVAGVYDDECHLPALGQQIQRIYERRLTARLFPGDSSHGQAVVHMDDVVEVCARLVDKRSELPADSTLLIGEPETPSYAAVQRALGRLIQGEEWRTREIPKALAKAVAWLQEVALPKAKEPFIKPWMIDLADDHYELDITRARMLLGWEPYHRLLTSLPRIVHSLRSGPAAFYKINKLAVPRDLEKRTAPRAGKGEL